MSLGVFVGQPRFLKSREGVCTTMDTSVFAKAVVNPIWSWSYHLKEDENKMRYSSSLLCMSAGAQLQSKEKTGKRPYGW